MSEKVILPCICEGNWRTIINECDHLIGKKFIDHKNNEYVFFGLVHGEDDYYYGMCKTDNTGMILLTCVGNLDTHKFKQKIE